MTGSDSLLHQAPAAVVAVAALIVLKIVDRESFFPGVPFLP